MCEGKCPEYIIGTFRGLNDEEAHVAISGDGEATVVTELKDIVACNFAGLKNHHTLLIMCSWLVKWTWAPTTTGRGD